MLEEPDGVRMWDSFKVWKMERVMGIEPTLSAWEAEVLPLNYTRFHLAWRHLLAQHDTDKKRCSHNPPRNIVLLVTPAQPSLAGCSPVRSDI